jgi:hypothetical protein
VSVTALPWRGNPNIVGVDIIAVELPPSLQGNYHLTLGSPAVDTGTSAKGGIGAPDKDIDGDVRPLENGYDIGADELVIFKTYLQPVFRKFWSLDKKLYLPIVSKGG